MRVGMHKRCSSPRQLKRKEEIPRHCVALSQSLFPSASSRATREIPRHWGGLLCLRACSMWACTVLTFCHMRFGISCIPRPSSLRSACGCRGNPEGSLGRSARIPSLCPRSDGHPLSPQGQLVSASSSSVSPPQSGGVSLSAGCSLVPRDLSSAWLSILRLCCSTHVRDWNW